MIERYSTKEIHNIWNEKNKFYLMLQIELWHLYALEKQKVIPEGTYENVRNNVIVDLASIKEYEKILRHDIAAFVKSLEEQAGDAGKYIHLGLTSSDIIDTAFSLQCYDTFKVIRKSLLGLLETTEKLIEEYGDVKMIGRTHGRWAEPMTFGHFLKGHYEEIYRCFHRMQFCYSEITVGKLAGPIGDKKDFLTETEVIALERLGLQPCESPTQVIPRDIYANFFMLFSQIANAIERLATNIRSLQREEIGELEEYYDIKNQQGSSSMPHKKNPILCENLCGIARMIRHHAYTLNENTILWDQRDISNSSVERVICPDISHLTHFSILRMTDILKNLKVNTDKMKDNLEKASKVSNSAKELTELVKLGLSRQEAYNIVKQKTQEVSA